MTQLLHPVPSMGPRALALAIYAHPNGPAFDLPPAAESGYEGVACVDDGARAALLYTEIWQRHGFPWARDTAEGLLEFVLGMQLEDGAFVNFIGGWDGQPQLTSPTSRPGGGPWQGRAMHALARAVSVFGSESYGAAFERGLDALSEPTPYLDMRALNAIAVLEYGQATGSASANALALRWAESVAACRIDDILPDIEGQTAIHLWGHLQEAALARIGASAGRDDLVRVAARSADAILAPAAESAFTGARSLAFDVGSTVAGLDAVAVATGDSRYHELSMKARAWFDGRNAAQQPVYERERGLVRDGIDGTMLNENSGAESNIEGALALIDTVPWGGIHASMGPGTPPSGTPRRVQRI
ncbi:MAG: hypothetical protein EPO65_01505 [Dehalococcoidia bacterium]|nr:MAG: hypothetical protein EPO65_01505 [Dehalococcoidia bacterium]